MTIMKETQAGFKLFTSAELVEDEFDTASWAGQYIQDHPDHKWVLAKYVEAEQANNNAQYWTLEDLRASKGTIENTPMNINHRQRDVVGFWDRAEMLYPETKNPYIETLGVFWHKLNPDTFNRVKSDFEAGRLFVSMECKAETVECGSCGGEYAYKGPTSKDYCDHINTREAYRKLKKPTFIGGGLILSGTRPGWSKASVKELARLTTDEEKDTLLREIAYIAPDAEHSDWEDLMWSIQMEYLMENFI